MTMMLLSTLLRFWQEFRSNKAAEELKAMATSTAAVLRAGRDRPQEMPISTLVPGDIVYLSARDMVPADVRLAIRSGLTSEQAGARLEQYGPNQVTHEKPPTWYQQLFHAFLTPFNGVPLFLR